MFEDRIEQAVANFKAGYNCSQSVVAAFADLYGFTPGTVSAHGSLFRWRHRSHAHDLWRCLWHVSFGRTRNRSHRGAMTVPGNPPTIKWCRRWLKNSRMRMDRSFCAELLGLKPKEQQAETAAEASERTSAYYAKRPCVKMVETAARIFRRFLEEQRRAV